MDFSLVMLIALFGTGCIWLLDRVLGIPARNRKAEGIIRAGGSNEAVERSLKEPVYVEYARAFFPVILVVFLLRSFLVEPFRIPSGSMLPSLLVGDFILVNKFAYGIRIPVINRKILDFGAPSLGDVVVFRFPGDTSINYIKRIVGLPGDRVIYKDKRLYINGQLMVQRDLRPYVLVESPHRMTAAKQLTEDLGDMSHGILATARADPGTMEFLVPDDEYLVMGDNRDRSNDSRYWGYVPDQNLVGKAFLVWFSLDSTGNRRWWDRIVWSRIGDSIQ
ncbi:MAG: signal peptidase I [Proteobacteria bacterium]|nr:MAG: signal peptidase I [Pseudomonadota bacterium]TDJ73095.1 MAG: signal peptidase I [Pseudomonadota bacterium]